MQETLNRALLEKKYLRNTLQEGLFPAFDSAEAKRRRDGVSYEKKDYRDNCKSKAVLKRRKRNRNKKTHRN
jgi:hypothetical protein